MNIVWKRPKLRFGGKFRTNVRAKTPSLPAKRPAFTSRTPFRCPLPSRGAGPFSRVSASGAADGSSAAPIATVARRRPPRAALQRHQVSTRPPSPPPLRRCAPGPSSGVAGRAPRPRPLPLARGILSWRPSFPKSAVLRVFPSRRIVRALDVWQPAAGSPAPSDLPSWRGAVKGARGRPRFSFPTRSGSLSSSEARRAGESSSAPIHAPDFEVMCRAAPLPAPFAPTPTSFVRRCASSCCAPSIHTFRSIRAFFGRAACVRAATGRRWRHWSRSWRSAGAYR